MTVAAPMTVRQSKGLGFTLMELIIVVAIIGILVALVIPVMAPLVRSSSMNQAAAMLVDELNLARQTALTQNRDVEVRVYRIGSKIDPGNLQYRAFRSFYPDGRNPAASQALSGLKYLPEPVIISSDPKISTLLDYGANGRSGLVRAQETLPEAKSPSTYISFLFRSTGGTNLTPIDPPIGKWYLTLYLENAPKNAATGIPDNYFTALVEPVTGRVRTFRP